MYKKFIYILKRLNKNYVLLRLKKISIPIFFYTISCLLDILILNSLNSFFGDISNDFNKLKINLIYFLLLIILRTFLVFALKKKAFFVTHELKNKEETKIMDNFIYAKTKYKKKLNVSLDLFKEALVNSSTLTTYNFDLPAQIIIGELIFALGGIFLIFKSFGYNLFFFNIPFVLIYLMITLFISKILKKIGVKLLKSTEERINAIDNLGENAFELAANNKITSSLEYFSRKNKPYNFLLYRQVTVSNILQNISESSALLIIFISMHVILIYQSGGNNFMNSLTTLSVLMRLIPSFTRTISSIVQISYGLPALKRIYQLTNLRI